MIAGLVSERERIARDLHDDVIQRLFATGLSLQAAAQGVDEPATAARITRAVEELNVSIRQIRSTIFELNEPSPGGTSLRRDVVAVCDEATPALGFRPSCDITGPIDSAVADVAGTHLLLCLREALSNVARHAVASSVHVEVGVDPAQLALRVVDDGTGYRPSAGRPSSGLDNMRARADALGGSFSIEPGAQGGTVVIWSVPLERDRGPASVAQLSPLGSGVRSRSVRRARP